MPNPPEQLGLVPIGTVGILIKAKRAGLIQSVRAQLDALQAAGFRLSSDIYDEAICLADGPQQYNLANE